MRTIPCASFLLHVSATKGGVCIDASGEDESNEAEPCGKVGMCVEMFTPVISTPTTLQIRGLSVNDALAQVKFCEKKASKFVETVNFTKKMSPSSSHTVYRPY